MYSTGRGGEGVLVPASGLLQWIEWADKRAFGVLYAASAFGATKGSSSTDTPNRATSSTPSPSLKHVPASSPRPTADAAWRALIRQNPENVSYYRSLLALYPPENELSTLLDLTSQHPRATAPRLLALKTAAASSSEFVDLAREHLRAGLTKGAPSLFNGIKALYSDSTKRDVFGSIVDDIRSGAAADNDGPDAPTVHLWSLYYLAQHHSHLGAHAHALSLVDTAISHTPTLPELYTLRGRILKRLGDPLGAAEAVEAARALDGQDRFLNTKAAKYRLRAGQVDDASDLLGLFTKKDAPSPGADLEDMQSLLYLVESARAEEGRGRPHVALKRFHAAARVFGEFEDDQYDFHGYSVRRSIVNVYIDMIEWADHLRTHPAYVASALGATEIYVRVHDEPEFAQRARAADAAEEKKAKKKSKKAAIKEAVKQASNTNANEDKGLEVQPSKDEDPNGVKLLTDPDPLERAWRLLAPVRALAPEDPRVWGAVYDVAVRRGKLLMAAQALHRAKAAGAHHSEMHPRLLHFRHACSQASTLPPAVSETLAAFLPPEADASSETLNARYVQEHASDARAIFAGARAAARTLGAPVEEVEGIAMGAVAEGAEVEMDIPTARALLAFLQDINAPRADEFRLACDARFKLSTVFKTPEELAAFRKQGVPIEEEAEIVA